MFLDMSGGLNDGMQTIGMGLAWTWVSAEHTTETTTIVGSWANVKDIDAGLHTVIAQGNSQVRFIAAGRNAA